MARQWRCPCSRDPRRSHGLGPAHRCQLHSVPGSARETQGGEWGPPWSPTSSPGLRPSCQEQRSDRFPAGPAPGIPAKPHGDSGTNALASVVSDNDTWWDEGSGSQRQASAVALETGL